MGDRYVVVVAGDTVGSVGCVALTWVRRLMAIEDESPTHDHDRNA